MNSKVSKGLQTAEPLDFYHPQIYLWNGEICTFFLMDYVEQGSSNSGAMDQYRFVAY